jgi:hypothetical protein
MTVVRETPGAGTRTPAGVDSLVPSFSTYRAVREACRAKIARLDYEQRSGKLLDADRMRKAIFEVNRSTRDRLLAIPDRVAPLLAGINDAAEVRRVLDEEIQLACQELSRAETV